MPVQRRNPTVGYVAWHRAFIISTEPFSYGDDHMNDLPKTLHYAHAARLLNVHEKTILRRFKIGNAAATPDVSMAALKKHFCIDPQYIADYFSGIDQAVATAEAIKHLGLGCDRYHLLIGGMFTPVAKWRNGTRYSAKRLGMMPEPKAVNLQAVPTRRERGVSYKPPLKGPPAQAAA